MDAPVGIGWRELVEHRVDVHGGWAGLADELIRRLQLEGLEAPELGSALKGLRRLAARAQSSGGQYGSWMLRLFGLPLDVERQLRWLAQYHSRFSDLPTSVRRDQLMLWDSPPISESRMQTWIHVGLASVALRRQEPETCQHRLEAALRGAPAAGPLAVMEAHLLAARVAEDDGRRPQGQKHLDRVEAELDDSAPGHLAYRARLHGQRAYVLNRESGHSESSLLQSRALFDRLPADSGNAFVDYKRTAGLAYCAWRLGNVDEGIRLARQATEHAGDGGYVRFRIMALNLLSRMVDPDQARELGLRARRLAESIEDSYLREVAQRRLLARELDADAVD